MSNLNTIRLSKRLLWSNSNGCLKHVCSPVVYFRPTMFLRMPCPGQTNHGYVSYDIYGGWSLGLPAKDHALKHSNSLPSSHCNLQLSWVGLISFRPSILQHLYCLILHHRLGVMVIHKSLVIAPSIVSADAKVALQFRFVCPLSHL